MVTIRAGFVGEIPPSSVPASSYSYMVRAYLGCGLFSLRKKFRSWWLYILKPAPQAASGYLDPSALSL